VAHEPKRETASPPPAEFKPYISPQTEIAEFTPKAIIFGILFGIIFGASTVYLALKAGLTVSASIPIAVLSISALRLFGRGTILENNIVQTIGSAGESVAAGVAFTVPALLFLSADANGEQYFQYVQIMILAAVGGTLGVLFMVPLRRSLIVAEHGNLPYPEGTACADVLVAGEKGGRMAGMVFGGVGLAVVYKILNSVFHLWKEAPSWVTKKGSVYPNATFAGEISPEYLGVGYILGPRVGGIMVAGSVLSYLAIIPLLSLVLPEGQVEQDLAKIGFAARAIEDMGAATRYKEAYTRYIGAGAVTMAGIITLLRTTPTIWRSLKDSMAALRAGGGVAGQARTERDIPISVVGIGAILLALVMALLPILPGTFVGKLVMAVLMLVFGFLFVTVSSRIVGLIGSSSNPISGMTIATLLGTCLVFLTMGLGGDVNQPIALSVGAIVCIAAANAGATSQDLKTGYLVGATPIRQQIGLVIGVLTSTIVIGATLKYLDTAYAADSVTGHGIGSDKFPAPQATLMATVIKGVMSKNLPWGYILVGAALSFMVWICGVSPLAWAVGAYLPISTTLPIFAGGMLRALADKIRGKEEESEVSSGMLFATGLVAGGTLTGVLSSGLKAIPKSVDGKESDLLEYCQSIGAEFQKGIEKIINLDLFALLIYSAMALVLIVVALKKLQEPANASGKAASS
jgi:putative OPT family oligopeptide transporter